MAASHPTKDQNPNYYAETASLGPTPAHLEQDVPPPQPPRPAAQGGGGYPPQPAAQTGGGYPQQPQYYFPPPPTTAAAAAAAPASAAQQGGAPAAQPGAPPSSSAPPAGGAAAGKPTFGERLYQWSIKAGVPINKVTNKLGSEAFWPSSMDLECEKAGRILKSFCKDGFYTTEPSAGAGAGAGTGTASPGPKGKPKVLVKIPPKAIETAAGLAIFTTFRTGLHISGASGSGIVMARLPDGSWSPPSGFLVHTLGAGFMIGLDIYDCVCVLRTPEAVRAFTRPRLSLGGEIGLVAGPVGAGASVEAAVGKSGKPVWSYMKSRGLYAGVQADGTVIVARPDANASFYGEKGIGVDKILRGEVPANGPPGMWPAAARSLLEVLKAAEGRRDVDEAVLKHVGAGPTPGDLGIGDAEREVGMPPQETSKQS